MNTPAIDSDERFGFGRNWRSFIEHLDEARIVEAEASLREFLGRDRLDGLSFLDIGSGSGLFSLAAWRLGARVHSFDYDLDSVACAEALRQRYAAVGGNWTIERGSVLDQSFLKKLGKFDIVYSWGVLHHTGRMHQAINNASQRVTADGLFMFALYRATALCGFWRLEKRWYINASLSAQASARKAYIALMKAAFAVSGRSFGDYVRDYRDKRGMDFEHDVHDWMGGYPYESIRPSEVDAIMTALRFTRQRSRAKRYSLGVFGSGCDEFVYRKDRAGDATGPQPASI